MLNVDMLACFCSAWLLGYFCCWLWRRNRNTKEGTPSASHNSDYAAALRVIRELRASNSNACYTVDLEQWCKLRLNA